MDRPTPLCHFNLSKMENKAAIIAHGDAMKHRAAVEASGHTADVERKPTVQIILVHENIGLWNLSLSPHGFQRALCHMLFMQSINIFT